jgi:hypothetical protein
MMEASSFRAAGLIPAAESIDVRCPPPVMADPGAGHDGERVGTFGPWYHNTEYCTRSRFVSFGNPCSITSDLKCAVC